MESLQINHLLGDLVESDSENAIQDAVKIFFLDIESHQLAGPHVALRMFWLRINIQNYFFPFPFSNFQNLRHLQFFHLYAHRKIDIKHHR